MTSVETPTNVLPLRPSIVGEPEIARARRIEDLISKAQWQFARGARRGGKHTAAGRMHLERAWEIVNGPLARELGGLL